MNPSRTRRPLRAALVVPPIAALALLAGCSSHADSGASSGGGALSAGSRAADSVDASGAKAVGAPEPAVLPDPGDRAVVSTGEVSLTSKHVGRVRTQVDALLRRYDGFVAGEHTTTDRHGRPSSATLTLRVPSARFDAAMRDLGGLGRLRSSDRSADDVTTQVLDVQQQIHAQEVGLRRLEQLMKRSASLKDLLAVERDVTDRQARLHSLKERAAYLADQTSLSTITLDVSRRTPPPPPARHAGFLGGLQNGWHALVVATRATLAGIGAALPFGLVVLVLWFPFRLLVRRVRAARPTEVSAG